MSKCTGTGCRTQTPALDHPAAAADKAKAQTAVEEAENLAARPCAYTGCSAPESAVEAQPRLLCFGCRALRYCSTGCQTADWPAHKLACRELAKRKQSS